MERLKKQLFPILMVILFALGFITQSQLLKIDQANKEVSRFEEQLHEQQVLLNTKLDEITETLNRDDFDGNIQAAFHDLMPLFEKQGLGFLITDKNKLLFWSHNRFSFASRFIRTLEEESVQLLPNGIFYSSTREIKGYNVIGLIHLKDNYSIENEFMENKFAKAFSIPENYVIQTSRSSFSLPVCGNDGTYLFSLVPPSGEACCPASRLFVPSVFFLLGFLSMFFFARRLFKQYRHEHFVLRLLVLGLSLFGLYWLHILFHIPGVCYTFELFSPSLYAYSLWLPSLGDLLLLAILIFFWSLNFAKDFVLSRKTQPSELIIAYSFTALFYLLINFLIQNLIRNSSFSFQLNRIDNINLYSLVGYFIIVLLFFSAFIINLKVVETSATHLPRRKFLITNTLLLLIAIPLAWSLRHVSLYAFCLLLSTNISIRLLQKTQLKRFSLSFLIYFVALFTFFSLIIIQKHSNNRREQVQKLMAITLYSEHDPAAEVFLTEIQHEMNVDSVIPYLLASSYVNLEEYINHQYFSGYFRKYDSQITVCDGSDSLLVQPDNRLVPCFPFFDEMIAESGTQIPGTNFYYMNNMNGRISYFGKIFYPLSSDSLGISVFIELKSKLLPEGVGFPELLLDKSMQPPARYRQFSYAKYYNKDLVYLSGEYQYNYYINTYDLGNTKEEFTLKRWDGYDHLIYKVGNNNYILVSTKSFRFIDYLISFPYLFVFYFIFTLLIVFAGNANYRRQALIYDLKFRIQASIISIVLLSMLLVAAGTIYYNIREYATKHQDDLNEKMKSIAEEINLRLSNVDEFTVDVESWLWRELNDLSNIFRTDINIFGIDGELIASSRPEIINRGIISPRMNAQAFYELTENYQINYIQPEIIGNLRFLSIYEPIINNKGEYLGFINLPYFTRGDELKQEVSTFIVAFINLYVLLFLASMIVAVLIANQITRPLSLIREKLKGIQLNKKNEQISYQRDDEIGALVTEYNRKVDELADSAELLARSEREMAWREMAKQIAHEIKNPLTPMKLNIQYLQRAKAENSVHYDEYFDRVTRTLIEQIDTLSDIATEFSNFAKIPKAKNEVFDLTDRIRHVAELFESNQQIQFNMELNEQEKLFVFADKEQVSRAVVNLVKNAIQSIPPKRKGRVTIRLERNKESAIISVKDNGTGIPGEIRQQMFQPNFTTKTSGMGLGLAIVKKITETFQGRIWFETELERGTTFFVEIPLYKKS